VAAKGDGPAGGRQRDYTWAGGGIAAVAVAGFALSGLHTGSSTTDQSTDTAIQATSGTGTATAPATRRPHPTTALGNLNTFAVITADVKAKVDKNHLTDAKTRVKDLEVAWDDAEAGLKPRDSAKWHQLDDEIDAVLTSLRASHPTQPNCTATLTALAITLDKFDGV
jgi:hypothetical protein